jgi:translation initiation factor 6 (eIF-6)
MVLRVNKKDKSVISKLEIKANSSGNEIITNKKSNLFSPSFI